MRLHAQAGLIASTCWVATIIWFVIFSSTVSAESMESSIEQLPITGMSKVTMSDGTTKYLSDNRRFVFVGKMYDLWQGGAIESGVELTSKVDLNRNGIKVSRMGFSIEGPVDENAVLFVAPNCPDCSELLKMVYELDDIPLSVVLLASTSDEHRTNAFVWCANDRAKVLKMVYVEKRFPERAEMNEECDRLGLMLAGEAAKLFGIAALPMLVSESGKGYVGKDAIEELIKISGEES